MPRPLLHRGPLNPISGVNSRGTGLPRAQNLARGGLDLQISRGSVGRFIRGGPAEFRRLWENRLWLK